MSALLDEQYLTWLYSQIGSTRIKNPSKTHWKLARQLFKKQFDWWVPNDDNRVEDGRDLRYEFLEASEIEKADPEWLGLECSMLELLIGLSRRLAFETDGEPRAWFWHMIEVLDLEQFNDSEYDKAVEKLVNEVLERVILRTYSPNGHGGLFPLRRAEEDQRKVELWYQASAYLLELL